MLSIITLEDSEKWDSIVKSFADYDVYYLSGYTRAFNIHGDGEPQFIYYQNEDIRGINVVMKRDIEKDARFRGKIKPKAYFDIATPYGYGGFIFEGLVNQNSLTCLDEAYSKYCVGSGIITEFVRFHPLLQNSDVNKSIYEVVDLGKTITMNLDSKDQIWDDLTSKNRNVIRKAKKSGVETSCGLNARLLENFKALYTDTMNRDGAEDYYYFNRKFYNSILNDLKDNCLLFYSVFEGKIISIAIILFANRKMHYHLSASDKEYNGLAATNLLLYEAACWGSINGFKAFHLGGGLGGKEDSLYKFKRAFNSNSETFFPIGKKIFDKKKYDELLDYRKKNGIFDINNSFFPLYRA